MLEYLIPFSQAEPQSHRATNTRAARGPSYHIPAAAAETAVDPAIVSASEVKATPVSNIYGYSGYAMHATLKIHTSVV